jgi:hypothetical protein
MQIRYIFILFIACLATSTYGQEEEMPPPYYFQLGGHFSIGVPIEAMRQQTRDVGFGGVGSLLFQLGRGRPLFVGVELGSLRYDSESIEYTTFAEGVAEDYRLTSNNNIFLWHGMLRFKPFTGSIWQPYVDGIFGFKTFYTRTKLYFLFDGDEELVEGGNDRSETVLSYGVAAGLQVLLHSFPDITLDIKCAYLPGGTATYYVRDESSTPPYNDPIDAYERATSPTSMLFPQIGVTFQFAAEDF